MRLADWERVLNTFLTSNELPRLQGAGSVSATQAERIAHDRYAAFDQSRKAVQVMTRPRETYTIQLVGSVPRFAAPADVAP